MSVSCRFCDFWYETQKKAKTYARKNALSGWNDVVVLRYFKPPYIPEDIWVEYIQHMTSEYFTQYLQSGAGNRRQQIHDSITMHTGDSVYIISHTKRIVKLFLITPIFN